MPTVEDMLLGMDSLLILNLVFWFIDWHSEYRRKRQRRMTWIEQDKPRRRKEFPDPLDPEISVEMVNYGREMW